MEAVWKEYLALLEKLGKALEDLTKVTKEKTSAVMRDDLMGVEACMKKEQVLSLTLRSLEKKREGLLVGLGMSGTPLSGLAERCPEELRLEAKRVAERVRTRYDLYRSAAEVARTTLECNLHQIEKFLQTEPGSEPEPGKRADIRA